LLHTYAPQWRDQGCIKVMVINQRWRPLPMSHNLSLCACWHHQKMSKLWLFLQNPRQTCNFHQILSIICLNLLSHPLLATWSNIKNSHQSFLPIKFTLYLRNNWWNSHLYYATRWSLFDDYYCYKIGGYKIIT